MARLLVHALFAGASTRISDYAALQWLMREFGDGKAAADRRAFEEARREFDGIEDEPAAVGEPEDASQDPASNAAEGAGDKDYTHIWRSKDRDFPCTPTGEEHRDEKDGRLYAEVRRPGGISIVPKDEVITKADALEPKTEPSQEPPTIADATALRRALAAAGYCPLPLYGKVPPAYGKNNPHSGLAGWQNLTAVTDEQIVMWARTWPDAVNTGILTRNAPALDLDILSEEAVRACEDLVRERFEERGYILVRIGKPPKRAILFRTAMGPFDKIAVNLIASNGTRGRRSSFLPTVNKWSLPASIPRPAKPIPGSAASPARSSVRTCPISARTKRGGSSIPSSSLCATSATSAHRGGPAKRPARRAVRRTATVAVMVLLPTIGNF